MAYWFDKKPDTGGDKHNNNNTDSGQHDQNKNNSNKSEDVAFSFVQLLKGKCYCCGQDGHMVPACKHRNKLKHKWAVHQAQDKYGQSHFRSDKSQIQDQNNDTNSSTNNQEKQQ